MSTYVALPIGKVPIIFTRPEKRLAQAKALMDKYLKPKIEVEKVTLKIEPKAWIPVIAGICGFILLLRVLK